MRFRILGPLEVLGNDGNLIAITRLKHRQLLCSLLLRANTTVTTDELTEALWGAGPPRSIRSNLKTNVSRLRTELFDEAVPNRIQTCAFGYLIKVEPHEIDISAFDLLMRCGRRALRDHDLGVAAQAFEDALAMWRAPDPLCDVPLHGSFAARTADLGEQRLAAFEELMEIRVMDGQLDEVIGPLRMEVSRTPLRERLWGLLILALYQDGRRAEALDTYKQLRAWLREELGIDPTASIQKLHQEVLTGELSSPLSRAAPYFRAARSS
ncbi:hypothetical protein GCM10009801_43540 [Streptomyces albiaxialis]|uniref:OmpR/PhoB-type domain-containing protein n=1 Tax=Streptomyces albiaxialis TaxID=329523 RepID=A0ABN2W4J5_9ACTN